ncbi:MAG TPA: hypothetical protein VNP37_00155 [Actinomycetospora sp.]|nr:hypothetical protein [Actinomycetospora sp.]
MSAARRAAPARPVWVPVPFHVRARRGFAWAALSGVLAAATIVLVGRLEEKEPPLVLVGVGALVLVAIGAGVAAFLMVVLALEAGPGDGMSVYGAGRRVEVTWASRRRERGRVDVEDIGHGEVVALRRSRADRAPQVTLRLGGHRLVLQGGPGPAAPEWYTVVDDEGYTRARADASPGPVRRGLVAPHAPVDWTIRASRGPILRLRHGHYAQPSGVTLLDESGTAWRVRDGRVAELPDDLEPAAAVFVVLLVDQLGRSAGARDAARVVAHT